MRHCITLSYGIVIGLAPASGVAGDKEPFMAVLTFSASAALGMKCIRSRNNIEPELTMFSILPNTSHFLESCALVGFHSFHRFAFRAVLKTFIYPFDIYCPTPHLTHSLNNNTQPKPSS
ncbi:hypothetical protein BFJ66_g271 [Fusarium oxysporum f. sp. cepae]|uniref:Secreted protein n=1 Tax=Fusarium oxysporum f. sp. cepae TaxID=396571 RepID=A0A3L6NP08_FUSOX|nr:hypothetical protein BFJ65_g7026 [Fusarium oxysporum f. sp. cepae]RKK63675.1 hypothetical protein BFJ66_g271 [Fusarium oxysporum f. sp. cepae]